MKMNFSEIVQFILQSKYGIEMLIVAFLWGVLVSELPMDFLPSMLLSSGGGLAIGIMWAKINKFL